MSQVSAQLSKIALRLYSAPWGWSRWGHFSAQTSSHPQDRTKSTQSSFLSQRPVISSWAKRNGFFFATGLAWVAAFCREENFFPWQSERMPKANIKVNAWVIATIQSDGRFSHTKAHNSVSGTDLRAKFTRLVSLQSKMKCNITTNLYKQIIKYVHIFVMSDMFMFSCHIGSSISYFRKIDQKTAFHYWCQSLFFVFITTCNFLRCKKNPSENIQPWPSLCRSRITCWGAWTCRRGSSQWMYTCLINHGDPRSP